jgi:hypothetical protein
MLLELQAKIQKPSTSDERNELKTLLSQITGRLTSTVAAIWRIVSSNGAVGGYIIVNPRR